MNIPSRDICCVTFAPAAFLNGINPVTLPKIEFEKFCARLAIGCPALWAISAPVILDNAAKTPAPVEILRQLDLIDLPTRFLFIRLLRLVTVLALARLLPRLANVYHNNNEYLFTTWAHDSIASKYCKKKNPILRLN